MDTATFTTNLAVVEHIDRLRQFWEQNNPAVSDVIDDEGHQYIDLVQEGGGVLGIALVGYTYALEEMGIRFRGLGGTSAGAINTMMLGALDVPAQPKSVKTLEILSELDMFSFVDGDSDARKFVKTMLGDGGKWKFAWRGIRVIDNFREDLGLNPGGTFLSWASEQLRAAGVHTVADLSVRTGTAPAGLRVRSGEPIEFKPRIAVVAADITTETKVIFPENADLYFADPDNVDPARFIRASMSVPGFFHPYRQRGIPKGDAARERWRASVDFHGEVPDEVLFVDGGIMSNFPINLFHSNRVPRLPTFGVKLGTDRSQAHETPAWASS